MYSAIQLVPKWAFITLGLIGAVRFYPSIFSANLLFCVWLIRKKLKAFSKLTAVQNMEIFESPYRKIFGTSIFLQMQFYIAIRYSKQIFFFLHFNLWYLFPATHFKLTSAMRIETDLTTRTSHKGPPNGCILLLMHAAEKFRYFFPLWKTNAFHSIYLIIRYALGTKWTIL